MVVDTDQVRQHEVRAIVEIDGRGTKCESADLRVGWELLRGFSEAQVEGEELSHASPKAVSEDDQLVVGKLFEFLHQRVQHENEDILGSISHSSVSLPIQERDGLDEEVLYDFVNF